MWSRLLLAAAFLGLIACTKPSHIPDKTGGEKPRPKPVPQGEALSPFTYLRKVSLHLRGQTPDRAEYDGLTKAIEKGQVKEYIRARMDHYLASDLHIDKMTFRLEELFALRASGVPFYSSLARDAGNRLRGVLPQVQDYPIHNSMNEFMRNMVSRNLSWDTLLTGKRYTAYPLKDARLSFDLEDLQFYATAAGTPDRSDRPIAVNFADGDLRVAGVLTTGRFFSRNVNTALNKNRRRAAAVFRAFLCDDMKAVVVSEKGNEDAVLDKVFPNQTGHGGGNGRGPTDPHGADPACMKCHYKLDPMGQTFQSSGMVLAPLASPGALVFTTRAGQKVNVAVSGLGELGEAIVAQDDYLRCQVKHFWRWFVGEDKDLNENVMAELTAKFNQVRRRPNDFISYLMERPEFGLTQNLGSNALLVTDVKGILRNCNGCHDTEGLPHFDTWPIDGDPALHASWITKIRRTLSLDGSTRPRTMPPTTSAWQPTPAQLATIQQWLDLGAPNE